MQYHQTKPDFKTQSQKQQIPIHETTESGYNELIYMDPTITQMMSPVTEGRQTQIRSPLDPLFSSVKIDLGFRNEKVINAESQFKNFPYQKIEKSPQKNIMNISENRIQNDYNIRTLNKKSPNILYNENIIMDQPVNSNEAFGIQDAGGGFQYEPFRIAGQSPILPQSASGNNIIGNIKIILLKIMIIVEIMLFMVLIMLVKIKIYMIMIILIIVIIN